METKLNYTAIGLFVIILASALILFSIWLSAGAGHKEYVTYAVYMKESVAALNENAVVKFNGVTVGYVSEISLAPQDSQLVQVLLQVEVGTPINAGTTATLMVQGITGVGYMGLNSGPKGSPPLYKRPNQSYPVIKTAPSLLVRLDAALTDMTKNFSDMSQSFKSILNEENQAAIKKTLANVEKFTNTMAANAVQIDRSIKAATTLLENSAKTSEQLPTTVNSANKVVREFSEQTMPTANETLERFQALSKQVESLAREIEKNPSMLLRGRAPEKPGPGE